MGYEPSFRGVNMSGGANMGSFLRRPSAATAEMPQNGTFIRRASALPENPTIIVNRSPELAPSAPSFPRRPPFMSPELAPSAPAFARRPSTISPESNPGSMNNANSGPGLNKGFEGAHPASFARRAMIAGAETSGTFVRRSMVMNPSLLGMQAAVVGTCVVLLYVYVCIRTCMYACMHVCMNARIRRYVCMCLACRRQLYTQQKVNPFCWQAENEPHTHIYVYVYIYICIYKVNPFCWQAENEPPEPKRSIPILPPFEPTEPYLEHVSMCM
jgi:hypothetical protein